MELNWDYHLHTVYAKHSAPEATVANMLAAAAERGLRQVAVVEHAPEISAARSNVPAWQQGRNERADIEAIAADLRAAAPRFPTLHVLQGVEVDADPFSLDGALMLDDLSGLDVVLGSTHVLPGGGAFWFEKTELAAGEAVRFAQVWRDWTIAVVRGGRIHVLAHPGDLIASRQLLPPFDVPEVLAFFDPLFAALAETGVAFELNELLGAKLLLPYHDSYPLLVRRAREHGLKFSVGSDAHSPAAVGVYAWVVQLIEAGGITEANMWHPKLGIGD